MDLIACAVCKRATSDPLLWPPDAKNRIVTCEDCFIELVLLAEEQSSSSPTPSSHEILIDNGDEVTPEEKKPSSSQPGPKNRRLHKRWPFDRSAEMSWLVQDGVRSASIQVIDGSEQGFGFRSPVAVQTGQTVRLKLSDAPVVRGDVRHCTGIEGGFRLGVSLRNVWVLPTSP